jgi:hypothetical protein
VTLHPMLGLVKNSTQPTTCVHARIAVDLCNQEKVSTSSGKDIKVNI